MSEAKVMAWLVSDFHVARQPVNASGIFPDAKEYLYSADREGDAREIAQLLRGRLTPLASATETARDEQLMRRAITILRNMAMERPSWPWFFRRWVVNHEPLRGDAARLLREIDAKPDSAE